MKPFAFILSFTNQKNCFVGLPRILVSTLGNARPNDKVLYITIFINAIFMIFGSHSLVPFTLDLTLSRT